ncbi:Hypothetical protein NTJ_11542 [Nesidiocoris tenuis]|uniref:Uncharacterized protein n=1 Tax=Nesidiocoris tenuis TaxID=355587 RepID=A0ABN7B2V1_9HEMI|nr:Hypothetical protein NTJ_11542 [Nesidiocoris tenuis]
MKLIDRQFPGKLMTGDLFPTSASPSVVASFFSPSERRVTCDRTMTTAVVPESQSTEGLDILLMHSGEGAIAG